MKFTIYDLRFTRGLRFNKRIVNFVFVALSLLLVSCEGQDSTLRRKLVGTWQSKSGEIHMSADGSFRSTFSQAKTTASETWNYQGTWLIENGLFVMALTNASAMNTTNFERVDSVDRFKVITADKTSLVLESDRQRGVTNFYIRK